MDIFDQLKRPFDENKIHWRIGQTNKDKSRGLALAYVNARDVMKRLDDVMGPERWQCRYPIADSGLLVCEIGLYLTVDDAPRSEIGWVWKANGAGDTSFEAEKGKCSDAFKRAAVLWGVGRYLYYLPATWVALENGRIIKSEIPRLPNAATPEGYDELMKKRQAA